jgi:glyoxylase-like metal-dependent hydrolase (beta-lactamase superfamily II)
MVVFPLSEGEFTIGRDKIFMPFNLEKDILNERPTGSLLVEVQPFLVDTSADMLVLDTGLGFRNTNGKLMIHAALEQHGYTPQQVTKVLLSHLHKDHAGGVMYEDEAGILKPTFPNARYYVYRPEAEFALQKGYPSYHPEEIEPLLASGQVEWLDEPEGLIDGYIRYMHSGGHCPEHLVYLIEEGGEKVFFGGDEAPQLKQMKIKYMAKYDYDGKKAMELREQYATRGHAEDWMFLFYHDVAQPMAKI